MAKRKVDPEKKREGIARVLSGASSYREEGKRLGVTAQTLHEAAQKIKPDAPDAAAKSPGPSPLEAAKAGAGIAKDPTRDKLTPEELKLAAPAARQIDEDYCYNTLRNIKGLAVMGGGMFKGIPLDDPRLYGSADFGEYAKGNIKVSAPELAPILRKYLPEGSTLIGLVIALAIDSAGTWRTVNDLSAEYKAKRQAEKEKKKGDGKSEEKPKAGAAPASDTVLPFPAGGDEPWRDKIRATP